jgi:hypothetical protein
VLVADHGVNTEAATVHTVYPCSNKKQSLRTAYPPEHVLHHELLIHKKCKRSCFQPDSVLNGMYSMQKVKKCKRSCFQPADSVLNDMQQVKSGPALQTNPKQQSEHVIPPTALFVFDTDRF